MALGYFSALFLAIFSLIFFLSGPDRLSPSYEKQLGAAEAFSLCHRAALAEARSNQAMGNAAGGVALSCTNAAMTNSLANGLAVTGIIIRIHPATDVGAAAGSGRVVTTYLPLNTELNGTAFNNVRAQFGTRFQGEPSAGVVVLSGGVNVINSVGGIQLRVPAPVGVDALAMVTSVQP